MVAPLNLHKFKPRIADKVTVSDNKVSTADTKFEKAASQSPYTYARSGRQDGSSSGSGHPGAGNSTVTQPPAAADPLSVQGDSAARAFNTAGGGLAQPLLFAVAEPDSRSVAPTGVNGAAQRLDEALDERNSAHSSISHYYDGAVNRARTNLDGAVLTEIETGDSSVRVEARGDAIIENFDQNTQIGREVRSSVDRVLPQAQLIQQEADAEAEAEHKSQLIEDGVSPDVADRIASGDLEPPTEQQLSAVVDAMEQGMSPEEAGLDPGYFPPDYVESHELLDEVDEIQADRDVVADEEDEIENAVDGLTDLLRHEDSNIDDLSYREEKAIEEQLDDVENDPNSDRRLERALDDLADGDTVDDLSSTERRAVRDLVDELEIKEDELEAELDVLDGQIDGLEADVDAIPLTDSDGSVDRFEAIAAVHELGFSGSDEWVGAELAAQWPPQAGAGERIDPRSVEIASELVADNTDTAEAFFDGIGAQGTAQLASVVDQSGLYTQGEGPISDFATAAAELEQAGKLNFTAAELMEQRSTITVPGVYGSPAEAGLSSTVLLVEGDFSAEFDISAAETVLAINNRGETHGGASPVPVPPGGDAANLALAAVAAEGPDASAELVTRLEESGNLNHLMSPDITSGLYSSVVRNPIRPFDDGSSGVTAVLASAGADPDAAQAIINFAANNDTLPLTTTVGIDAVLAQNVAWLHDDAVDLPGVDQVNSPLDDATLDAAISNVFENGGGALVLAAADNHITTVTQAALSDHPTGTDLNRALNDIGIAAEPLGRIQGLAYDVGYENAEDADERVARAKTALGWLATGASIATVPVGGWGGYALAGAIGVAGTYSGDALIGPADDRLNFVTQEFENGFVIDDHLANHIYEAVINEGYLPGYTLSDNGNVVPEIDSGYYGQGFDPRYLPDPYDPDFGESWLAQIELVDADGNKTGQTLGEAVNAGSGGLIANYNDAVVENSERIEQGDVSDIFGN